MKRIATAALAAFALIAPLTWAHDFDSPAASATEIHPLLVGSQLPELKVRTGDGELFDVNAAVSDKPAVLIFYRGGW